METITNTDVAAAVDSIITTVGTQLDVGAEQLRHELKLPTSVKAAAGDMSSLASSIVSAIVGGGVGGADIAASVAVLFGTLAGAPAIGALIGLIIRVIDRLLVAEEKRHPPGSPIR